MRPNFPRYKEYQDLQMMLVYLENPHMFAQRKEIPYQDPLLPKEEEILVGLTMDMGEVERKVRKNEIICRMYDILYGVPAPEIEKIDLFADFL